MNVRLENIDANLDGFDGEIEVFNNIRAEISIRQPYEAVHGDYDTPTEYVTGNIDTDIKRIFLVTGEGEEINVNTDEMEDHIKKSLIIN